MGAAFTRALDIAESLGDYRVPAARSSGPVFLSCRQISRYRAALPFAQSSMIWPRAGRTERSAVRRAHDGRGQAFSWRPVGARRHLEQVLARSCRHRSWAGGDRFQDVIRFQTDLQVTARVFLARVLWLQGFPDQAVRTAETSIGEAQATGHAMSLCYALALAACPIALWTGNLAPRRTLYRNAASIIRESTALSLLERVWSPGFKELLHSRVAISTQDRGCCEPALTRSPSQGQLSILSG